MKKFALSILTIVMATSVFAQVSKPMTDKLKKEYPNLNVKDATFLPGVNLYEVRTNTSPLLSYTNENVDFFLIAGEIISTKDMKNITKERESENVKRFYRELPFDKAITYKFGKGTRQIAIFTDPDCPFCKATDLEIHTKLTKSDLTVHYFMNPLNIPGHEQAPLKAAKIWCAPNKQKAWTDFMLGGQLPNNPGTCKNPVAETKALSTSVGFNSTPTIVFDNGLVWRGAIQAEQILQILQSKQ